MEQKSEYMKTVKKQTRFGRGAGVLLPVASLPSRFGIGTFGREAYRFVDFLKASGQRYWQVLPLGPTSYGDSPYQSFSAFAGNPYFIDLETLVGEGLLTREEVCTPDWGSNPADVDYAKIYQSRFTKGVFPQPALSDGGISEILQPEPGLAGGLWLIHGGQDAF